jgi:hypothetical protein
MGGTAALYLLYREKQVRARTVILTLIFMALILALTAAAYFTQVMDTNLHGP